MNHPAVERAKEIVNAQTWEGEMRVNMTTLIGAGRVLARRVTELEKQLQLAIKGKCLECEGTGAVDSGGSMPWGEWINVPCPYCEGSGRNHQSPQVGERFRGT